MNSSITYQQHLSFKNRMEERVGKAKRKKKMVKKRKRVKTCKNVKDSVKKLNSFGE